MMILVCACIAGGTSDIGAGLSNLVSWHKAQEFKIKEINS